MSGDIVERLLDLHRQATIERSHYYTGKCIEDAIGEIAALRHDIERHMAIASREAEARCKMEDALRKMVEALEDDGEHTRMGSRDQCDVCDAMAAAQALLDPSR